MLSSEKVQLEGGLDWLLKAMNLIEVPQVNQLTKESPELTAFLDRYDGIDVAPLFQFVCERFPFDCTQYELVLVEGFDEWPGFAAWQNSGHVDPNNDRAVFASATPTFDLDLLVAELACQISRFHLAHFLHDSESSWLQNGGDLLPLFFGMGVCCANASLFSNQLEMLEDNHQVFLNFRSIPTRFYGAALACLAYRGHWESKTWRSALRPDAKGAMNLALRYYQKSDDCLFLPTRSKSVFGNDNLVELAFEFSQSTSPGTNIAVLEELEHLRSKDDSEHTERYWQQVVLQLPWALAQDDPCLRRQAASFCKCLKALPDSVYSELEQLLLDSESTIREAAIQSIVSVASPGQLRLASVRRVLCDQDLNVADWASLAVLAIGEQDEGLAFDVLPVIRRALNDGEWETAVHLTAALEVLSDSAHTKLAKYFSGNRERLSLLKKGLEEWNQQRADYSE